MSIIVTSVIVLAAFFSSAPKPMPELSLSNLFVLVDTRDYRHCHNDRGRFTYCFKKDPRDRAKPKDELLVHTHQKPSKPLNAQERQHGSW